LFQPKAVPPLKLRRHAERLGYNVTDSKFALKGQVNIDIYLVLIKLPLQGIDWINAFSLSKAFPSADG
jgi:hypothetical protein